MTLRVLQTVAENQAAREEMRQAGFSYWPRTARPRLRDWLLLRSPIPVGEMNKSWDVLQTVRLLQERLPADAPILDMGAWSSEILCCLHMLGFTGLTGIDLNSAVRSMPFENAINWVVGDMMATPFPDASMMAITSISAIEHGFALRPLFREVSRLLAPGGLFIASTDYWPEKIDTNGIRMFGLEWTIFSQEEIAAVLSTAGEYGLRAVGDLNFNAAEPTVDCVERRFTFVWFALEKVPS
ncbi:MAG TPA: class I SAM-dependent methyltransferase [Thermoanaerobaculia bacterium]|jgi:SAM-dependent methyltransferase|nr:class I SAM-dependent methyltransferase [Thermoanaerobaculia bacterium]